MSAGLETALPPCPRPLTGSEGGDISGQSRTDVEGCAIGPCDDMGGTVVEGCESGNARSESGNARMSWDAIDVSNGYRQRLCRDEHLPTKSCLVHCPGVRQKHRAIVPQILGLLRNH